MIMDLNFRNHDGIQHFIKKGYMLQDRNEKDYYAPDYVLIRSDYNHFAPVVDSQGYDTGADPSRDYGSRYPQKVGFDTVFTQPYTHDLEDIMESDAHYAEGIRLDYYTGTLTFYEIGYFNDGSKGREVPLYQYEWAYIDSDWYGAETFEAETFGAENKTWEYREEIEELDGREHYYTFLKMARQAYTGMYIAAREAGATPNQAAAFCSSKWLRYMDDGDIIGNDMVKMWGKWFSLKDITDMVGEGYEISEIPRTELYENMEQIAKSGKEFNEKFYKAESNQFPSMHYGDQDSDAQEKYQEFLDEWDLDDDPPSIEEWIKEEGEYDRRLQEYEGTEEYRKAMEEMERRMQEDFNAEGKKRSGLLSEPFEGTSLDSGEWKGILTGFGIGLLGLFGYSKLRK